jgi:hypothetical protein
MRNTLAVYLIWYGDWTGRSPTQDIIRHLVSNIGGSRYWATTKPYYDSIGTVSQTVSLGGEANVAGTSLTDAGVISVAVTRALNSGVLGTLNPAGLYVVLPSNKVDTTALGFCSSNCGWHSYGSVSTTAGRGIATVAFVGDPVCSVCGCCALSAAQSPNRDQAGDAMASVLAHEMVEAATDPQLNAWWDDVSSEESSDLCAWTFGTFNTSAGTRWNVQLGSATTLKNYYLQQQWLLSGICALAGP